MVWLKLLVLVTTIMDGDGLISIGKFWLEVWLPYGVHKNIQWCCLNCNQLLEKNK